MQNRARELADIRLSLRRDGFAFASAERMRPLLDRTFTAIDWDAFAATWDDLASDTYLAKLGRHRRRRHAVYRIHADGTLERQTHQPHVQTIEYNPLQGGIERWFEPISALTDQSPCLRATLALGHDVFAAVLPNTATWRVEVHQFRIEARPGEAGQPTPEGRHRDGVDFVLVLMIDRRNVASGTTSIHQLDGTHLGEFTLARPLDAAWVVDARVLHGVTPVESLDPTLPAYRDVLVATFKAQ